MAWAGQRQDDVGHPTGRLLVTNSEHARRQQDRNSPATVERPGAAYIAWCGFLNPPYADETHGRMLRQLVRGDVRRSLFSEAFVEGWAHYAQELMVDQGFRADDPRFAIGVYLDALVAVTGLASAIGIHRGAMTVDDATARFEADAFLLGPAARSEATRATYDPTYGRYTWGKLEIISLRDQARGVWGTKFSLRRFHESLLAFGAPPLGTMGDALVA